MMSRMLRWAPLWFACLAAIQIWSCETDTGIDHECFMHQECPQSSRCKLDFENGNKCVPLTCFDDSCPSHLVCDRELDACPTRCSDDVHCRIGFACDLLSGQCQHCSTSEYVCY